MSDQANIVVEVRENSNPNFALKKFKRLCEQFGIGKEYRKRKEHKKRSLRLKEKKEAAAKRRQKAERKFKTQRGRRL